jgi:hypothetical protein
VKFDQLTQKKFKNFDQTPNLTENFDQLKMSSEIRSSDRFPKFVGPLKILKLKQMMYKQNKKKWVDFNGIVNL